MGDAKKPLDSTTGETAGKLVAIGFNYSVPLVGGLMSDIANEIISKRQNRRLNDFLTNLAEQL